MSTKQMCYKSVRNTVGKQMPGGGGAGGRGGTVTVFSGTRRNRPLRGDKVGERRWVGGERCLNREIFTETYSFVWLQ